MIKNQEFEKLVDETTDRVLEEKIEFDITMMEPKIHPVLPKEVREELKKIHEESLDAYQNGTPEYRQEQEEACVTNSYLDRTSDVLKDMGSNVGSNFLTGIGQNYTLTCLVRDNQELKDYFANEPDPETIRDHLDAILTEDKRKGHDSNSYENGVKIAIVQAHARKIIRDTFDMGVDQYSEEWKEQINQRYKHSSRRDRVRANVSNQLMLRAVYDQLEEVVGKEDAKLMLV